MKTAIAYDFESVLSGIPLRVSLDWDETPHAIIFGSTGSGKTWACKGILANIFAKNPDAILYLCDFKGIDYAFAKGYNNAFLVNDCEEGFAHFFSLFQARQNGTDTSKAPLFLCFDEWASWLSLKDKKAAEDAKNKLAQLLMLGRAFNVHAIIAQQRVDADYFNKARDNFGAVLALGTLSKESRKMFFSDFEDSMQPNTRGRGYLLQNGITLTRVIMPRIEDMFTINAYIANALQR